MFFLIFIVRSGRRELAEQEEYQVLKINTLILPENAFICKIFGVCWFPAVLLGCKYPEKHSGHPGLII